MMYDSLPPGRRQLLHRNIATRLLNGHVNEQADMAAELALHFELGGECEQAIGFLMHM